MTQQQQPTTTTAKPTTATTDNTTSTFNSIKTFSTRNKSSLSISTQTNNNNNLTENKTSYSCRSTPSSPPSSPPNHATRSLLQTDSQPLPTAEQPQFHYSTSSVGPNVAGRIGVGGNVMVDPYNPSHLSHRGTIGAGAFVYKVYNMLLDPSFQHLISFNSNGQSFTVNHVQEFSKTVLPKHFKHSNFSSFVRQLNMYGFHKVNKTPRGQRGNDNSAVWEFLHPKFHRGRPDLLEQIRRKTLDHDSVPQLLRKDHPNFSHPQSSPTGYRFPLDSFPFLPNLTHHPPSYQLVHAGPSSLSTHLPLRPKSDGTLNLSPTVPTHNLNMPDILNPSTSPLLDGSSAISPHQPNFLHGPSSDRYPNPFLHSPYSGDHISSNTSQTSSAPITPLSAVPPPSSSPLNYTIDPNRFSTNPIEILLEMKNDVSNRFQGIHVSYEQLYQELHETRRKQKILIDLVEKMYKSLQSSPNLNLGYEFPLQEVLGETGGETTPIFKITEHDYPDQSPMIVEESTTQQQCGVSVGASPLVSEFSHTNQPSTCDNGYRSFSSVCPGGFGNLTIASYPNSPVGGLINDQNNSSNKNSPGSVNDPGGGLLETSTTTENRFLNPAQHMRPPTDLNTTPISPRAALSAALKTPLPPSPAPFKHQVPNTTTGSAQQENTPSNEDYHHAIHNFIHHPNLSTLMGEFEDTHHFSQQPPQPPPNSNQVLVKNEESTPAPSSFDKMISSSTNDTLIFPSSNNPNNNSVISNTANSTTPSGGGGSKKRPASNSMDLSAGISHLHHHLPLPNHPHPHLLSNNPNNHPNQNPNNHLNNISNNHALNNNNLNHHLNNLSNNNNNNNHYHNHHHLNLNLNLHHHHHRN